MSGVVVLGGGLAGVLAATALAQLTDEVTVLESDTLPDSPQPRKGLPQGRHSHMLMSGGAMAMDALLPGTQDALFAAGAQKRCMPWDIITYSAEGWYRRHPASDAYLISLSRDLLDHVVRQKALVNKSIKVLEGAQVLGLTGTAERVTGVRYEQDGEERTITADFVVDTTGRRSKAPEWLTALGLPPVKEEVIDPGVAYATRLYHAPDGVSADFPAVMVQPKAGTGEPGHGASLFPIEDGKWIVAMYGTSGAEPPTDEEGFLAHARNTRHPIVAELIASAEPAGEIRPYRATANRRRRFDQLPVPQGFLVMGDALTALNPLYGHGMSVAAQSAAFLAGQLRQTGLHGAQTRKLQTGMLRVGMTAWMSATTVDVGFPNVRSSNVRSSGGAMVQKFNARVMRTGTCDAALSRALFDVSTLSSPNQLFKPSVLLRVARGPQLPPLTTEQALAQYPELGDVRQPVTPTH